MTLEETTCEHATAWSYIAFMIMRQIAVSSHAMVITMRVESDKYLQQYKMIFLQRRLGIGKDNSYFMVVSITGKADDIYLQGFTSLSWSLLM